MNLPRIAASLLALLTIGAAGAAPTPTPTPYVSYADDFDQFEARTTGMPAAARVAEFRREFERIRPGLYADSNPQRLDRRILRSLEEFPTLRPAFRSVEQRFGGALSEAVAHFRTVFPDFSSPLPIILAHELGVRDGGSDFVAGRKVMLFGADMIAELHNDDSLRPFLEHELFHLEHARHFADCDQFWCLLWQEGLATYAASTMTDGANDHQLLLDQPRPIRRPTDQHWKEALCTVAMQFDGTDGQAAGAAFTGARNASDLPPRFGYYVGLRVAAEAAQHRSLPVLTRLDDEHARPIVADALSALLTEADAACPRPAAIAPIARSASRPA